MKSDDPRLAYIPFLFIKYGFRRNSSNDLRASIMFCFLKIIVNMVEDFVFRFR